MNIFTQIVVVIGKITPNGVGMLGTGFIISNDGKIITSKHVVGPDPANLVILAPHTSDINAYQDTSDTTCQMITASVLEMDPIKDLCLLKADITFSGSLPQIGSFDELNVGEKVGIFSYPHCVEGRRVLTFQETEIGAKVLLDANSIKSKHAVINTQARPGQSGGIVFSPRLSKIVGILIGAYAPSQGGGISLGGINPRELHQTTHCISAEYINDMI
jgi:S1-C subfamily serine protease